VQGGPNNYSDMTKRNLTEANSGNVERRPIEGKEDLSRITTLEFEGHDYSVEADGVTLSFRVPDVVITTNLPTTEFADVSLQEKVGCFGMSSGRQTQNREELEGANARVAVYDYKGYGRIIIANCPAPKKSHIAADAAAHVLAVDPEGNMFFSGVIADGNSTVRIPAKWVDDSKHTVRKKSGDETVIDATGSPVYADIAARNAFRGPAYFGRSEAWADLLVSHINRNPSYIDTFGGSTVQLVNVRIGSNNQMTVEALNLGIDDDLGHLTLPDASGNQVEVPLRGNEQDLSFEGRLYGYAPEKLKKTLDGDVRPIGVVQISCDGVNVLPETLPGGRNLAELVNSDPDTIVRYLSKGTLGQSKDDETLVIFIPDENYTGTPAEVAEEQQVGEAAPALEAVVPFDDTTITTPAEGDRVVEEVFTPDDVASVGAGERNEAAETLEALYAVLDQYFVDRRNVSIEEIAATVGYDIRNAGAGSNVATVPKSETDFGANLEQKLSFLELIGGPDIRTAAEKGDMSGVIEAMYKGMNTLVARLNKLDELLKSKALGETLVASEIEAILGIKRVG